MTRDGLLISYAYEDQAVVETVVRTLQAEGVSCWLERDHLKAGDTVVGTLNDALSSAAGFVVFLSAAYLQKRWTQKELRVAVQLTLSDESRKLFVVRLDTAPVPAILADLLHTTYSSAAQTASEIASRAPTIALTHTHEVQWDSVPDHTVYALARRIVDSAGSGQTELEVDAGNGAKYRLRLVPFLLTNEMLMEDLRLELDICRAVNKLVAHLRRRLVEGGLGLFEGAFELDMERRQHELATSRVTIRKQMGYIAPHVLALRTDVAGNGQR